MYVMKRDEWSDEQYKEFRKVFHKVAKEHDVLNMHTNEIIPIMEQYLTFKVTANRLHKLARDLKVYFKNSRLRPATDLEAIESYYILGPGTKELKRFVNINTKTQVKRVEEVQEVQEVQVQEVQEQQTGAKKYDDYVTFVKKNIKGPKDAKLVELHNRVNVLEEIMRALALHMTEDQWLPGVGSVRIPDPWSVRKIDEETYKDKSDQDRCKGFSVI